MHAHLQSATLFESGLFNVIAVWLSFQAFCSSMTGTLATQAMLKGYGVGDEKATALAATMTWILRSKIFDEYNLCMRTQCM